MNNHQLMALTEELRGKTPHEVDEALRRRGVTDVVDRIAIKHQLGAGAGPGRTVRASGELATDPELERTLRRLGLSTDAPISLTDLDARLTALGMPVEQRIGTKILLEAHGLLAQGPEFPSEAARMVDSLGITGPISLAALEDLLDRHGIGSVTNRICVRAELQRRGWLTGGTRSLRAAAGTRLVDDEGRALTLRSWPA